MALSPMMVQYKKIKLQYPNAILMFRLGDFYEMFFEDAITASQELDLTLTGRNCGLEERAPMCGVPHHAVQTYISKLIKKGYKVAVCDQLQDPKETKGMVDRGVTRIITSGTITDSESLSDDKNNYIMSLYLDKDGVGAVWADITTSETFNRYIPYPIKVKLNDLLLRVKPAEIICNSKMLEESVELSAVKFGSICEMSQYDDDKFEFENAKATVGSVVDPASLKTLLKTPACVCAEGALIEYVRAMQFRSDVNVGVSENYESERYMDIDANTAKTLELVDSQSRKRGTALIDIINKTCTPMGGRLMQQWLLRPLYVKSEIDDRLNAVDALYADTVTRERLRTTLAKVKDVIRISSALALGEIKTKDVTALGISLAVVPEIKSALSTLSSRVLGAIAGELVDLTEIADLIDRAIANNISGDKEQEKYIIASDYDEKLDEYRNLVNNSRGIIAKMESEEREKTGIKNLRISYNRLFGYYIEVPRQFDSAVPQNYQRRQTVANAERYITDELKDLEYRVLNAAELAERKERELYLALLETLRVHCREFNAIGKALGVLDCLVALAVVAKSNGYCKPEITTTGEIVITEGRHPVAENLPSDEIFVPNNTALDSGESKIMLITGPNMAGKSLYMRQVALIVILAHMGSFVPAKSAKIGLVDKLFTRVGASDDISTGRSTFMVEMTEVSQILENATDNSLILLDEIGRGTATYDGLSIAWSVMEYLANNLKAKVLFSTHYHEMTELEGTLSGLKNYKFTAKEQDGGIKFLRKIMRGSANKSFGIEVSALAGLPRTVIDRAKQLLTKLLNADIAHKANDTRQVSMFDNVSRYDEVITILKEINVDDITPRTALDILCDLKEKIEL
ncbi:MAG: DNA mismatch repair protein MutS [Clostridiales bacterium]|nr:DNA mismatch repair protein MutS [Clostridiales bacterium]